MDLSLVGIVGSILAAAASVYAVRTSRGKVEAETESVYIANAERLVTLMQNRLDKMQEELDLMQITLARYQEDLRRAIENEVTNKREITRLMRRVEILEGFIRAQGLTLPVDLG